MSSAIKNGDDEGDFLQLGLKWAEEEGEERGRSIVRMTEVDFLLRCRRRVRCFASEIQLPLLIEAIVELHVAHNYF